MIERLVILGATGDLTLRHLMPALARLIDSSRSMKAITIAAIGRRPMSEQAYRALVDAGLRNAGVHEAAVRAALHDRLTWRSAALLDQPALEQAIGPGPALVYLALPPDALAEAIIGLARAHLAPPSRVIVEKPYGGDLASARRLDGRLMADLPGVDVVRVDHFLQHELSDTILAARTVPWLASLWNQRAVDQVDIVWDETTSVGDRARFYDRSGALRDMIQSHLLQLLALVAMDPPASPLGKDLAAARIKLLEAVRVPSAGEIRHRTSRARYTAGASMGGITPAYVDEPGVDPARGTETFATVDLSINRASWAGVPFRLRTGKALGRSERAIVLRFRRPPGAVARDRPSSLRFEMLPDQTLVQVTGWPEQDPTPIVPIDLSWVPRPTGLPASARIIHDALLGDTRRSLTLREVEAGWRIVDPIRASWNAGLPRLLEYAAGSAGPRSADEDRRR